MIIITMILHKMLITLIKKIDTLENRTRDRSMNVANFGDFKDHTHNQSIRR